jgi:acyl-CoA dehydrogenase
MKRSIFSDEHELFRKSVRGFVEREVIPNQEKWAKQGMVDREAWLAAGEAGLLCPALDPEYGGAGGTFLHSTIIIEELCRAYESGFGLSLHSDIVVPYIESFGSDEQKQKWLPRCATGELITAVAMTEPGTGSDLAGIKTTAKRTKDGWVINGSKTFISNGLLCDLVVVAAKTGEHEDPHRNVSLFVVEATAPGFKRGKKLHKMGLATQDTAEMFFEDCEVPEDALLGAEGGGFLMLMQKLQPERLVVAAASQASAEKVLEDTVAYCKERQAFGRSISRFQNTQFVLADLATKVEVGRHFLDAVLARHVAGEYLVKECSMAKLWQSEMLGEVVDACVQLFGGYGYMMEYPVARAYVDARVQRIYAGTSEIMKLIIARQMGL